MFYDAAGMVVFARSRSNMTSDYFDSSWINVLGISISMLCDPTGVGLIACAWSNVSLVYSGVFSDPRP